jgi:addiction module RelE/StbE family toxin
MKVIWSPRAAADLERIANAIEKDKPDAAAKVASRIYHRLMALETTPEIGRIGVVPGTREIVFHPWPYIAVYKISRGAMRIILIRHASQRYP